MKSASADARQVKLYLASQSVAARKHLAALRKIILSAAPGVVEGFSYGIPSFKLGGRPLVWYAGFKKHVSLYPMTAAIRRAHAEELKGYEMSTGTIRFPLERPLPMPLVRKLVKARMGEMRKAAKKLLR